MGLDIDLVCTSCHHVVYEDNVTHNLTDMARAAGVYKALWRPEDLEIKTAKELKGHLSRALRRLSSDPGRYQEYNPENGWGDFEGFIQFISRLLVACIQHPDAKVRAYR